MSVKTENVDQANEQVIDDISEIIVEDKLEQNVDADKLAALKVKLAASMNTSKITTPSQTDEVKKEESKVQPRPKKNRSIEMGIVGSGQAGCIDGQTNIYVSEFGIIPIKRLFTDVLNNSDFNNIDVQSDGQTCIRLSKDLYTVSIDPETGELKKAKILAVWKNRKYSKNKITTSNGTSIVCSKTHPSLVFKPSTRRKAYWKSLSDTLPLSINDNLIDSRLEVLDLISTKTYVRNIEVTKEIAWLLGLFAGDGSNKSSGNEISFYIDNDKTLNKLSETIKLIPHTSVSINDVPGCKQFCVYGLNARLFFESAFNIFSDKTYGGQGSKTYTIEVPKCISAAYSEIRAAFFAGIIDSDGTVCKDWCETSFYTCSKLFADQVGCLLSSIGARGALEINNNIRDNEQIGYRVRLNGKINHGPLFEEIIKETSHSMRKERLIYWANNTQKSFATSVVPLSFEELEYLFKKEGKMTTVNSLSEKSGHDLKSWASGQRELSIPTFHNVIDALEDNKQLEYVKNISSKLIEIKSIESCDDLECEFFDLTVEKYENYLAGNNGFIFTHNSRLAEAFYRLGYDAVAFNTAQQDLEHIDMPNTNKIMLDYSLGGASKDPTIGHEAANMYRELISDTIRDKLADSEVFVFCTSLGGGSGGGSIDTMIDIMSAMGKPIIVITVLPMTNEDAQTKKNSLEALGKLAKKIQNHTIHNLIVVDNAKIESIFSDVGPMQFYQVSNKAIVDPLDVFNTYSASPSRVKSLDPMEFGKILIDGSGLSLYGSITVANYEEDTALAEAVITNLTSGLLAEGFNLKQTQYCGVIFLANKNVWDKLPSASINYAMSMVQDHAGTPLGVFRGIYEADIKEDVVKVYSFFSGLALPDSRVDELKAEVAAHASTLKNKDVQRNLSLNIDTGESETLSTAEKIKEKIKQKASPFGKFTKGFVDKRK